MQTQGKLTLLVSGFGVLLLFFSLCPGLWVTSLSLSVLMTFTLTFPSWSKAAFLPVVDLLLLETRHEKSKTSAFLSEVSYPSAFSFNIDHSTFFFSAFNLIGCSKVSKLCISLQNSFRSVVRYWLEYDKLNLQKTYLLAHTFLWALPSGAVALFSSAYSSSLSLRHIPPAHLSLCTFNLQGTTRHHSSPTIPLPHTDVPITPTLFCAAGAHFLYTLTGTQPKIQELTVCTPGGLNCSKYSNILSVHFSCCLNFGLFRLRPAMTYWRGMSKSFGKLWWIYIY